MPTAEYRRCQRCGNQLPPRKPAPGRPRKYCIPCTTATPLPKYAELCAVDGCSKKQVSRGWCQTHYTRWNRHGDPLIVKHRHDNHVDQGCTVEDCDSKHYAHGLCKRHYAQRPEQMSTRRRYDTKRQAHARAETRLRKAAQRAERRKKAKYSEAKRRLATAAHGQRGTGRWYSAHCKACGECFLSRWPSETCSKRCRKRLDNRLRADAYGNHRERARYYGVAYEPVGRRTIFERDGYRCQLCGLKTTGKWPHPRSPTLDHIVPLACGGPHIESNLQCACAACNSLKGDRAANDQLRLV